MTSSGDRVKIVENDCVRCGSCTVVCPVHRASGGKEFYSARGRKHLEKIGEDFNRAEMQDIFSQCLLCGACSQVCPRGIDCTVQVRDARARRSIFPGGYKEYLAGAVGNHPEILSQLTRFSENGNELLAQRIPAESGLRLRLAMFEDVVASKKDHEQSTPSVEEDSSSTAALEELIYFPGCTATYLTPSLLIADRQLFARMGYDLVVPDGLGCCGLSSLSMGNFDDAVLRGKQNIETLERSEGPILISCASCFSQFHSLAKLFHGQDGWQERAERITDRCVELSQFLANRMEHAMSSARLAKVRVFYHDPCHFRHELGIMAEPRALLKSIENVELLELPGGPQCCGMGGLLHLGGSEISTRLRDDLKEKVMAQCPDIVTTTCSNCLMQWKTAIDSTGSDVKVIHLSELLNAALHFK